MPSKESKRQNRKPLSQTKTVDEWKCPWCRERHSAHQVLYSQQTLHESQLVLCPSCKNEVLLIPSVEFTCIPYKYGEPI